MGVSTAHRRQRFTEMYDRHEGVVMAYACRRLEMREDAEDVALSTFLVAWRRFEEVPAEPLPWLLGVAGRVIANERRAERSRVALHEKLKRVERSEGERHEFQPPGLSEEALHALLTLSEWEREALLLLHWEGLQNREAAVVLGCPAALFTLRVHRARQRLARELSRPSATMLPLHEDASEEGT
jgi:RNA polymerase sigma-70 factor, ECF subfamily